MQLLFSYWEKLTTGSTNRQIFGAALTVALMTVLVKMAAMAKELVLAWRFGTGDELDAFLIAYIIPTFIINVVAGSFNAALIPTYVRVREQEGLAAAQRLFSGVMLWSMGLLGITTLLIIASAPVYLPWLAQGFSHEKLSLTFHLLCAIAPVILLSGIVVIWGAVLNAGKRFALAALSPIFSPALSVLFLMIATSWGIFALALGLVFGSLLEMLILGITLRRQGIFLRPRWYGFEQNLRQIVEQYVPMIVGAFLMSSTTIVDQSMAAMLAPGSVAALNYGSRVIALPIGLGSIALGTAVMPYFSSMIACGNLTSIQHTFNRYLKLIFIYLLPLTALLALTSQPLVQFLFQRGEFSTEDTKVVTYIQVCYSLQIPFYIAGILVVRLISSLCANQILMWGAAINLICNILLNYFLIQVIGVSGIALSTSIVYIISFLFLLYFCKIYSMKAKENYE